MIYQKVKAVFVVGLTVSLLLDLEGLFDFYATQVSESLPTKRAYEGVPEVPTTPGSRRHLTSKTETEYRSPLEEFPMQSQDAPLPNVLEVIEQYKQQHSVDALRNDPMIDQRKFIVATYSCPTSAGNWLHYFTSHFFWGILTNRTILWKYADYDTCMGIRADHRYPFNMKRCNVTGVAADCGRLLTRAPWIASFDEWKEKLKLPDTYHIAKHHTQWFLDIPGPPRRKPLQEPALVDVIYSDKVVVDIHPWAFLRMDYLYMMPHLQGMQLGTQYAKEKIEKLGEWGALFLFGLLWRYSFDFKVGLRQSVQQHPAISATKDPDTLTIAVHSRHTHGRDSGCNVTGERNGILEIMQQVANQRHGKSGRVPCQVTLLSDRPCTIETMKTWLQQKLDCTAVVTEHTIVDATFKEHGPFSGAGFFKDMLLAGLTVKDAMIGSLEPGDGNRWRSSSELVEEAIAYHRAMTYWQCGKDPKDLPSILWSTVVEMESNPEQSIPKNKKNKTKEAEKA